MAYECFAIPTNECKERESRMRAYGTSFRIKYFGLSDQGHDPNDPRIAEAVDPSATQMPGGAPLFGPELIDDVLWRSDICETYVCKVLAGEYQGEISSIGLFAEIVYVDPSDPSPPSVGYVFLAAVCNRPLMVNTSNDTPQFNVSLFY